MTLIKICRVRQFKAAQVIAWQGADLMGLHFIDRDDLVVENPLVGLNRQLIDEVGFHGGVLLTKSLDYKAIETVIRAGKFNFLQIHSAYTLDELQVLRRLTDEFRTKLIAVVDPNDTTPKRAREINSIADFLLIDHRRGGTGERVDPEKLATMPMSRTFIAGGLDASNVREVVDQFQPIGVDVQSKTESIKNAKDIRLTATFIRAVRPTGFGFPRVNRTPTLSLSASKIATLDRDMRYKLIELADSLHIDFTGNDESVIPSFSPADVEALLADLSSPPVCDIHLLAPPQKASSHFENLIKIVPLLRTCYLQYCVDIDADYAPLLRKISGAGVRPGIAVAAADVESKFTSDLSRLRGTVLDILVVGPSSELDGVSRARQIASALDAVQRVNPDLLLAVDRAITTDILGRIRVERLAGAVVGDAIVGSSAPCDALHEIRSALAKL